MAAVNSPYSVARRTAGPADRDIPNQPLAERPADEHPPRWVRAVVHARTQSRAPQSIEVISKAEENSRTACSFVHPIGITRLYLAFICSKRNKSGAGKSANARQLLADLGGDHSVEIGRA